MSEPSAESLAALREALPCGLTEHRTGRYAGKYCDEIDWSEIGNYLGCVNCEVVRRVATLLDQQLAQARAEERERCISVIQETAGLALRIRSAYGYLLAQSALTSDTTLKDIATKEFSDHRDEFRRLGELLGVQNP